MEPALAVYVHIPFCRHRCAYCDFNTYAGQESLIPAYVDALCREIRMTGQAAARPLRADTVFFGGGTPSLLTAKQLAQILGAIQDTLVLQDPEISLEANPGTVTASTLADLRAVGFNRISFGVQSFHPEELRLLERIHDVHEVFQAVTRARRAGFDNLNLDLIYGLPGASAARWSASLRHALDLHPEHVSLYALTIEAGTPFGRWVARGLMPAPDPDLAADLYEQAGEALEAHGFSQYEISNWSAAGFECRHNLHYWRNQEYLGFGAGAHGSVQALRYANVLRIRTYLERMASPAGVYAYPCTPAVVRTEKRSARTRMQESMFLGLRLTKEGVDAVRFKQAYGSSPEEVFWEEIVEALMNGLLEREGSILRLTRRGRLLGNQVFMQFVD
jgi:oxygen-independent coproporphyrinogen-3 oxidase